MASSGDRIEHARVELPERGRLGELPMAELVRGLHADRATAALRLGLDLVEKTVFVVDGRPVFVESDLRSETLGAYLVRLGRLSDEDHRLVIERMRQTGRRQGELLLEAGLLGPHELYEALVGHMTEKVVSCFAWTEGAFRIDRGAVRQGFNLPLDPVAIVLAGIVRHHGEDRLDPPAALAEGARPYVRSGASTTDLALGPREARILRAVEKGDSLGEILVRERGDRPTVDRFLHALYVLDRVGFDLASRRPAPSSSPPRVTAEAGPSPRQQRAAEAILAAYLRLERTDCFSLLGLDRGRDLDAAEVAAAYEARLASFQPEGLASMSPVVREKAAEIVVRLGEARDLLSSPTRRAEYLAGLSDGAPRPDDASCRLLESETLFREALAALERSEPWVAVTGIRRALALKPGEPQYTAWLGWALYLADPATNRRAAEGHLENARRSHPDLAEPYVFMARICEREGEADRAADHYGKAVALARGDLDMAREAHMFGIRRQKGKLRKRPAAARAPGGSGLETDVGAVFRKFLGKG